MLGVREPNIQTGDGMRVEIFPSFLSGYGRKLYVIEEGSTLQIPDGRAHAHGSEDCLIPIAGDIWVAYQTANGEVKYMQLIPGHRYVIPPNLPHQVEIRGGILESLFPTAVYEHKIPIHELAGGFFEERRSK